MSLPDRELLARQIAKIFTVGFGKSPRSDADVSELLWVAEQLVDDPSLHPVVLLEEAMRPSVERLGDSLLGRFARWELEVDRSNWRLHTLDGRRELISKQLGGMGLSAVKSRERETHLALADDMLVRLKMKNAIQEADETDGSDH